MNRLPSNPARSTRPPTIEAGDKARQSGCAPLQCCFCAVLLHLCLHLLEVGSSAVAPRMKICSASSGLTSGGGSTPG